MNRSTWGSLVWLWALVLGFVAFCLWRFAGSHSPDLMATWLAGHFYEIGATDQVYPADDRLYTMLPPDGWWPYLQEQGWDKSVFPYVYPPLWAVLASWITPLVGMQAFQSAAAIVNPALMAAMVIAAGRATGLRELALVKFTALGLALMIATLAGSVALEQNQPQILVSFLIVAAIERDRAGAAKTAGAALALAAAIKLYPALLAILWIAGRRWGAVRAFGVAGAALGGLSVALAGWPLHLAFLHEVGVIKDTVLVTYFTYGIDPTFAQIALPDRLEFIAGLDNDPADTMQAGWAVMAKGPLWAALSALGLAAVMGAGVWRLRRGAVGVTLWPAVLVGVALVSPLSWGYHYLPALAFAPALIWSLGLRRGALALLCIVVPLSVGALDIFAGLPLPFLAPQVAGTLAVAALGALFWRLS